MTRLFRMLAPLLTFVALSARAPCVGAQVDPRGALRTVTTQHFRVHFRADQDTLARRLAVLAEDAYAKLATQLVAPRGRIDLALADNIDASNGFAQTFPNNRVVVYAVPPVSSQELRFQSEWLRLVVTHELTHIFQIDRARGVWSVGRNIFGRNPLFFPNNLTPSWVKEGIAVYFETRLTGSGRLESTESRVVMRSAAVDSAIPPVSRWSLATTRFPQGQTAYAWGSQLIERAATAGGDRRAFGAPLADPAGSPSSVKRFVENVASYPIPFLLNARARRSFGASFGAVFNRLRDSLLVDAAGLDSSGDAAWRTVGADGWYAESPRWIGNDSLVWTASNGREVTGLYVARVDGAPNARRIGRRNTLDVNVPTGDRGSDSSHTRSSRLATVFTQTDFRDPYTIRSDIYVGRGSDETQLTHGARITAIDARADGRIVGVELGATTSRLVIRDGVTRQTSDEHEESARGGSSGLRPITNVDPALSRPRASLWAEPRWSPDGRYIAAAELLPGGSERIVILDTLGTVVQIVAGGRGVFASPTWTPNGRRLVWTSDRSGRMQLETSPVAWTDGRIAARDTSMWCAITGDTREASAVRTAVYQPSISPRGDRVAALVYRVDGFHVAVASLDTNGPVVRNLWYPQPARCGGEVAPTADADVPRASEPSVALNRIDARTRGYAILPQLLPRYWLPEVGTGRDGGATYGLSSSASDIFERHDWFASLRANPRSREIDASARYRYRGLGQPVLDASLQQEWDATFRVADTSNRTLGTIARRRRFATISASVSRPRVRFTPAASLGAQYEWRDFTSAIDSLLGPAGSLTRVGTRYPSVFASGSLSTLRRSARSIAFEEGITLGASTSYRWRQDAPSLGSLRSVATVRAYRPLDFPGFARHVVAARVSGGFADTKTSTEFSVGGVSGESEEVVPGFTVGDPARTFGVRGVAPGIQRGIRAVGGSVEYRFPLLMLRGTPSPFTVYTDRLSVTVFSDAARAWCPASLVDARSTLCERRGDRDGIIASAGAELTIDLAVQYDVPYRLRIGAAAPYARPAGVPGRGAFYVTLGGYF